MPCDHDETDDLITDESLKPKSVSVDGQSIQRRDLRELIDARQQAQADAAVRLPHRGLRFSRFKPPGSI